MYKKIKSKKTTLKVNKGYEGETIEEKIQRIVNNKEPIKDGAPLVYTDRKDGVQPQYDIRTDRFEIAVEAMDKVTASYQAKREFAIGERTYDTMTNDKQNEHIKKFPQSKHKKETNNGNPEGGTDQ